MCNRGGFPADSFYEVRHECGDVSRPRFKIKVGKTLSPRRWHSMLTPEGYLDFAKALSRIQRGGVHPSIRGEVWEFLLGCYDPQSTFDERDQLRKKRRLEYARQKEECREMDPLVGRGRIITAPIITENGEPIDDPIVLLEANLDEVLNSRERDDVVVEVSSSSVPQENGTEDMNSNAIVEEEKVKKPVCLDKKVIQWKRILHQIGLDVVRTDRALVFYEQQENLSKLWDILAVYAWIDKDVGYCQGMSDLCSPMIVLLENEADAFWCFERLMRRLRGNFRCTETSVGVERLLSSLASVTQILDPKLHQHLETIGGGGYLFAFRMLMVLFRREFSFGDSLYLWEMMWALEYDPYLFSICEHQESVADIKDESRGKAKSLRQFGKFERQNVKNGGSQVGSQEGNLPISVFIVANVLKLRSSKLMREARGVDDVVKILNDTNGRLDAKKACTGAMKLHKKYLKKVKKH